MLDCTVEILLSILKTAKSNYCVLLYRILDCSVAISLIKGIAGNMNHFSTFGWKALLARPCLI
jgi:hypothetical protein